MLVLIDESTVDVSVPGTNGNFNLCTQKIHDGRWHNRKNGNETYCVLDLTGLRQPRSQPNLRKLLAGGESDDVSERHFRVGIGLNV